MFVNNSVLSFFVKFVLGEVAIVADSYYLAGIADVDAFIFPGTISDTTWLT